MNGYVNSGLDRVCVLGGYMLECKYLKQNSFETAQQIWLEEKVRS